MILPLIFVFIGALSLLVIIHLAKGHHTTATNLDELKSQLRPIDVDAFRNLIDEREEQFLRQHLLPQEYRKIHHERMLAAVEYVKGAARNAAIFIRLGEAARQAPDPAVAAAANKLLQNALRLRLYAFQAVPRLYLCILFPSVNLAPQVIADTYDTMTRQGVMLGCLQYPTRGMSSAL